MKSRGGKAGRSSQAKYDELVKQWRRANRKIFWTISVGSVAVVIITFVVAVIWPSQGWILGFVAGTAVAFYAVTRLMPPGWIENWQIGAWGEESTAKALRPLAQAGWVVLHDLPANRGNVDHLVIGPAGVFLLDSKRLSGTVEIRDGEILINRFDDPDIGYRHPGAGHLLGLAREAHQRIRTETRISTWVTPVMVFWCEFPQTTTQIGAAAFVHGDALADWLLAQPQRIAPARLPQVVEAVRKAWSVPEGGG